MKIKYFQDADTLCVEFKPMTVSESRDLDAEGDICGITVEHAQDRTDIPQFFFEQIAA